MSINKKYVMAGVLATSVLMPMADATDSYAKETRTTTANVNLRKGPGTKNPSIMVVPKGKKVTYVSKSGSWAKVQYNSKTGYIHVDYLKSGSTTSSSTSTSTSTKYVKASEGLNVRKGPSTSYAKVAKLTNGTKVTVVSTSGGWSKIKTGSTTGYVSSSYLTSKKPSTPNNDNNTSDNNTPDNNTSDNNNQISTSTKYVKSSAGLNVRKGAGTNYAKVGKLADGAKVTVHSTSNGWSKITSGSIKGYVSSTYLTSKKPSTSNDNNNNTENEGSQDKPQVETTKYVKSSAGLNVRKGAGTSHAKVGKLADKAKVTVHSTSNGWSKITSGSIKGYVSSSYLTSKKPSTSNDNTSSDSNASTTDRASKVISYAKKFLGKPYVWGAQGPNSFDCSGFTYYVYKNSVGVNLPRTSSMQSRYGKSVSKSNLKAGDLVFFDTVGANNGGVTHCGIYMGGGQIIHAASGQGKVVINNFNSSYYQKAFVNARRVL